MRKRARGVLLATSSTLALAVALAQAGAAPVSNPATPFTNAGTISAVVFNDGNTHVGDVVNAGPGLITGTSGTGVLLTGGGTNLTGNISNAGTIHANTFGIGLQAGPHTITGSIVNAGLIAAGQSAIRINAGSLGGGISNAGTILSAGVTGAISITGGSTIGGRIANSGTISVSLGQGVAQANGIAVTSNSVVLGGGGGASAISNSGVIKVSASGTDHVQGILEQSSSFAGGIRNSGSVGVTGNGFVVGVAVFGTSAGGGFVNSGLVGATNSGGDGDAYGVLFQSDTFTNGVSNAGTISTSSFTEVVGINTFNTVFSNGITNAGVVTGTSTMEEAAAGILAQASTFSGGITNSGLISMTGAEAATGISVFFGNTVFQGGITNLGTILVSATGPIGLATGIFVSSSNYSGGITNGGTVIATSVLNARGIRLFEATASGGVTNTGTVRVSAGGTAIGIVVHDTSLPGAGSALAGGISNAGVLSATGGTIADGIRIGLGSSVSVGGGITNTGTISASGTGAGIARGIAILRPLTGGISNAGLIAATGKTGEGIVATVPVGGGIRNSGTLSGSSAAIDLSGETGGATAITQAGGMTIGSVLGPGAGNGDAFNLTGGSLVLGPTAKLAGLGTFAQTGGTLALTLTPNTAPGAYPTLHAGNVSLGGPLALTLQGSGFAARQVYANLITASGSAIAGGFTSITPSIGLFSAATATDPSTANSLDLILSLNPASESASAQVLTQSLRFGLDAPELLIDTVETRLQVGRTFGAGGLHAGLQQSGVALSDSGDLVAAAPAGGTGLGAGLWGRAYGVTGSAPAKAAAPAFDLRRFGGIVGADWRWGDFAAGVAGAYERSDGSFADGSHTRIDAYQGILYGAWRHGAFYASALGGGGVNDDTITRNLVSAGLAGVASSSPRATLAFAHAEAGWRLEFRNWRLTPYAGASYIRQSTDGFTESGPFGALTVAASTGSSLESTVGLRAAAKLDLDPSFGSIMPELRLGWSHEFLDARQALTAALAALPAAPFTAVGANFGRESARLGVGLSHDISSRARVFLDYDGKLTGGFDQHAVSAGVKLRF